MQKGRFSTKGEVCLFDGRREVSWCRVNVKYTLEKDLSQKKEYIYYQLIYFTIVQCLVKRLLKRQTSVANKKYKIFIKYTKKRCSTPLIFPLESEGGNFLH